MRAGDKPVNGVVRLKWTSITLPVCSGACIEAGGNEFNVLDQGHRSHLELAGSWLHLCHSFQSGNCQMNSQVMAHATTVGGKNKCNIEIVTSIPDLLNAI